MSENLDDYLDGVILSDRAILERVDEYTLLTYYLGYEPELGTKYQSPVRDANNYDSSGSFSLYTPASKKANNEYLWKDNGTGNTGNIFKLVGLLHGVRDKSKVLRIIDRDFSLGFSSGEPIEYQIKPVPKPQPMESSEIAVKSKAFKERDFRYWLQFAITEPTLKMYNVTSLELYWLYKNSKYPKVPRGLAYAYRIWSRYKLYQPDAKPAEKFRNNFTDKHIEGFCQLRYDRDLLIISKANKENMMFREFGYESVASHSENNLLSPEAMKYLETKYKHIVVWYDNDGKHLADKYPYDKIYVPIESGEKDPTDYCKRYGPEAAYKMINQLLK